MDRCKDYFGFAMGFAGIGYAVLWPLTAIGNGGHPFALPVGLHALGLAAVLLIAARLSCRLLRRWRPRASVMPAAALAARLPGALPARARKKPARTVRAVKPRKHFGLRGLPR
jgi:hypothetical protein